eukprot:5118354-Pleurochrysis_carterae.AAC.1
MRTVATRAERDEPSFNLHGLHRALPLHWATASLFDVALERRRLDDGRRLAQVDHADGAGSRRAGERARPLQVER